MRAALCKPTLADHKSAPGLPKHSPRNLARQCPDRPPSWPLLPTRGCSSAAVRAASSMAAALAKPDTSKEVTHSFRNAAGEKLEGTLLDAGSQDVVCHAPRALSTSMPAFGVRQASFLRLQVILQHGLSSHRNDCFLPELAAALAAADISTFRFDFSGNGVSEGVLHARGCLPHDLHVSGAKLNHSAAAQAPSCMATIMQRCCRLRQGHALASAPVHTSDMSLCTDGGRASSGSHAEGPGPASGWPAGPLQGRHGSPAVLQQVRCVPKRQQAAPSTLCCTRLGALSSYW